MKFKPFFIFYVARSGSTMLARLLADKFGYIIPPESRFVAELLKSDFSSNSLIRIFQYFNLLRRDKKFKDWGCSGAKVAAKTLFSGSISERSLMDMVMYNYFETHFSSSESGEPIIFGFKKGSYRHIAEKILSVYPEAKFLCLVRDGRAVFNSQKKSLYTETKNPFETDCKKAAIEWVACVELFKRLSESYHDNIMLVRYEDLLIDQDRELDKIYRFLGNNYLDDRCAGTDSTYIIPERYSELHKNVYKNIIDSRSNAWQDELTEEEIYYYENIAGKTLIEMGYILMKEIEYNCND